jgi:hypothetical protein
MSTSEREPRSCWECKRGKILHLPGVGDYVDCPPDNWTAASCVVRQLDTIANRFRRGSETLRRDSLSEPRE